MERFMRINTEEVKQAIADKYANGDSRKVSIQIIEDMLDMVNAEIMLEENDGES